MDTKNVKKVRSAYRKKRRFRGNQFTKPRITSAKPAEDAVEDIAIRPAIHTTASQFGSAISGSRSASAKKISPNLNKADQTSKRNLYESQRSGFRFFDMQTLCDITSLFPCPECFHTGISLREFNKKRYGNSSFLKLR